MANTFNGTETRTKTGGVRLRKNILHLSPQELNEFRNALEGLFNIFQQEEENNVTV